MLKKEIKIIAGLLGAFISIILLDSYTNIGTSGLIFTAIITAVTIIIIYSKEDKNN